MTLFIGNLSYDVVESDLEDLFSEYNTISEIKVFVNEVTGRAKGYAHVEFSDEAEAYDAVSKYDGFVFFDRPLKVAINKEESLPSGNSNKDLW